MRVLITGATGFIGSHLVEYLINNTKNEVFILKRSSSDIWRIKEYINKLKTFDTDKEDILDIIKKSKPDVIIHLATYYKKNHNYNDLPVMIHSNIEFPVRILEAMASENVTYFINTGTFFESVYSYGTQRFIKPLNLYASTKLAFEELMKFYLYTYDIKGITLKLFSPYGYRENPNKLIPYLINKILKDEEIEMTAGDQTLDFTYVKDIIDAYIKAIEYIFHMKEIYQTFEIGTGVMHTLQEVVSILEKISGKVLRVSWGKIPYAENEVFYSKADIRDTMNFLRWKPKYDLEKGLKETFEWYKIRR
ncbi:MAG: NAD-dependent epimerase/dehydratase family protein [Candidatus Pelagibacter ubique]